MRKTEDNCLYSHEFSDTSLHVPYLPVPHVRRGRTPRIPTPLPLTHRSAHASRTTLCIDEPEQVPQPLFWILRRASPLFIFPRRDVCLVIFIVVHVIIIVVAKVATGDSTRSPAARRRLIPDTGPAERRRAPCILAVGRVDPYPRSIALSS